MVDRIDLDAATNCGTFYGSAAQPYAYKEGLRRRLDEIRAHHGDNRYFVLDGATVLAAQPTEAGAMAYMRPGRVLLAIQED